MSIVYNIFLISVVDCAAAIDVFGTKKEYISDPEFTGIGASVRYTCIDGYIANERDAIGKWTALYFPSNSLISTCQSDGRWRPRPYNIHCLGIL